jgi:FKBP-type peptidyl-prolyl cis-trans isomerase
MKKNVMFLLFAAIAFASCNGGFKKGDAGMLYNIHIDKSGPKIQDGDFVVFGLVIKTDADSLLVNTYEGGRSVQQLVQKPQQKNDVFAAMEMLAEGDSATFKVSMDSIFKKGSRPPQIKGKYIIYQMKIDKVIPKGKLSDQVFQGRVMDYMKGVTEDYKKKEPAAIKKYIADHNLKTTETPEGLNYVVTQPGSGPNPVIGDTVLVNYTVKYLNDQVLETSSADVAKKAKKFSPMAQYKPIPVALGSQGLIQGWNVGMLLLNKGAKATLVVPSKLAYGEQGNRQIPPFTPLTFDVELVSIKHPDPNAPKPVAPPQFQFPAPSSKTVPPNPSAAKK